MSMTYALTAPFFDAPGVKSAFSFEQSLKDYLLFETSLTEALGQVGQINVQRANAATAAMASFEPDQAAIETALKRDGVPIPEFVRQLRIHVGEKLSDTVHIGATSQDLVDTATVRALLQVETHIRDLRTALVATIDALPAETRLTGVTRMQSAKPIKLEDRASAWTGSIATDPPALPPLQFGGAVGTREAFGVDAEAIAAHIAARMGLSVGPCWHADRSALVRYADWMTRLSGALGKIGQDICLMALMNEVRVKGAGTSSAMPHKANPVAAENLVTQARFSATLISGLHHAQVHEMERSGAAWSLEWLILPQIAACTATGFQTAIHLIRSLELSGE